jgi:hypothetical protein
MSLRRLASAANAAARCREGPPGARLLTQHSVLGTKHRAVVNPSHLRDASIAFLVRSGEARGVLSARSQRWASGGVPAERGAPVQLAS